MKFPKLVHAAMSAQRAGVPTAHTALLIRPDCASLAEAHWIARAAEVYRRILDRELRRGRRVEWVA